MIQLVGLLTAEPIECFDKTPFYDPQINKCTDHCHAYTVENNTCQDPKNEITCPFVKPSQFISIESNRYIEGYNCTNSCNEPIRFRTENGVQCLTECPQYFKRQGDQCIFHEKDQKKTTMIIIITVSCVIFAAIVAAFLTIIILKEKSKKETFQQDEEDQYLEQNNSDAALRDSPENEQDQNYV